MSYSFEVIKPKMNNTEKCYGLNFIRCGYSFLHVFNKVPEHESKITVFT